MPGNYIFGDLFEQMIVLELIRLNDYLEKDFTFSYLRTGSGVEVDLIVERPGLPLALIEIKSADRITPDDTKSLRSFKSDFQKAEFLVFSREKNTSARFGDFSYALASRYKIFVLYFLGMSVEYHYNISKKIVMIFKRSVDLIRSFFG